MEIMESLRKHIVVKNRNRIPIDVFSLILENCTIASAYNTWARLCYISAKAARKARSKHIKRFLTEKTEEFNPYEDFDYESATDFQYALETQTYYVLPNGKKHGPHIKTKDYHYDKYWTTTTYEWNEGILLISKKRE